MTARTAARGRTREAPPAAGAEVMATGIVSVGLHLAGAGWPSVALLAVAAALWAALGAGFARRLARDRRGWADDAATPAALTGVAGTCVLGVRLSLLGWDAAAAVLLGGSAVLWAVLLPRVVRRLHGRVPGAAYLVCVSTQSLVVLAGTLAVSLPARLLLWPAIALFVLGLVLYCAVLAQFDFGQLRTGAGDHWVAGGAVAISALAAAKLTAAATSGQGVLRAAALALLAVALAWYAVLVCCEIRWPRPHYDLRRWSTVFPLGMTAVATITTGTVAHAGALVTAGRVLLWPAVIVWAVVAAGAVRHRFSGG